MRLRSVIGLVGGLSALIALGLAATAIFKMSNRSSDELAFHSESSAEMICADGSYELNPRGDFWTWMAGDFVFRCREWQTRDLRDLADRNEKQRNSQPYTATSPSRR